MWGGEEPHPSRSLEGPRLGKAGGDHDGDSQGSAGLAHSLPAYLSVQAGPQRIDHCLRSSKAFPVPSPSLHPPPQLRTKVSWRRTPSHPSIQAQSRTAWPVLNSPIPSPMSITQGTRGPCGPYPCCCPSPTTVGTSDPASPPFIHLSVLRVGQEEPARHPSSVPPSSHQCLVLQEKASRCRGRGSFPTSISLWTSELGTRAEGTWKAYPRKVFHMGLFPRAWNSRGVSGPDSCLQETSLSVCGPLRHGFIVLRRLTLILTNCS